MNLKLKLILSFMLICYSNSIFAWKVVKYEDGITIYTKPVKGSKYLSFKAVMHIKSDLTPLVALVLDVNKCHVSIDSCEAGKVLYRKNVNENFTYRLLDFWWPINDRDLIQRNVFFQSSKSKRITIDIQSMPGYISKKDGIIRVEKYEAKWRFLPTGDGFVKIKYISFREWGGSISEKLVNMLVPKTAYQMMDNFRTALKRPQYQQAKLEYVKESRSDI